MSVRHKINCSPKVFEGFEFDVKTIFIRVFLGSHEALLGMKALVLGLLELGLALRLSGRRALLDDVRVLLVLG